MLGIYFRTLVKGQYVGQDPWKNRYYRHRGTFPDWRLEPRWVIYHGIPEASKVPPLWNAWLRHQRQRPPLKKEKNHFWEKPHLPNLTGTLFAFNPVKSLRKEGGFFVKPLYEAWVPPSSSSRGSS